MTELFIHRTRIEAPAEEVFRWHMRPGAFERLNPPWDPVEVVERTGTIEDGGRVVVRVKMGPFRKKWVARHQDYQPDRQFRDVQEAGPFAHFEHLHRVHPEGERACTLEDRIEYRLPLGFLGRWFGGGMVRRKLESSFAYRHRLTRDDIAAHTRWQERPPMRVLVSGATGLIGSSLVPFLTTGGHEVVRLTRSDTNRDGRAIQWKPAEGVLDAGPLEGVDAVVHLAGEGIAERRWSAAQKARIRDSRVQGTRLLCDRLASLANRPKVLVCASAIGWYGDRGRDLVEEQAESGSGFLAEVCREWESATEPAVRAGIRVVNLRIGVVLSSRGGALASMLTPFRLGAGGRIGSGEQYWSWVALDDVVGAIHHALMNDTLNGPVNAVSPHPATNLEFTKTLGRVLRRPTILPMPGFAARLALGEMADELLLASIGVTPRRLIESAYPFRHANLEDALRHTLGLSQQ